MEILFTKNRLIGSKLIRAVTREDVSHCALKYREYVLHSNFQHGVHLQPYKDFAQEHQIVHRIDVNIKEEDILDLICKYIDRKYDYLGFIGLGLRILFRRFIPKINIWQISGMFLCTEFVTEYLYSREMMLTPGQLYNKLSNIP